MIDPHSLDQKRFFAYFKIGLLLLAIVWPMTLLFLNYKNELTTTNTLVMGVFSVIIVFTINTYVITKIKKIETFVDNHLKGLEYSYGIEVKCSTQDPIRISFTSRQKQENFLSALKKHLESNS